MAESEEDKAAGPSISQGLEGIPAEQTDEQRQQAAAKCGPRKRSNLDGVINDLWGFPSLDDEAYLSLIKDVDPDSAKKKKTGFELTLLNGGKINWNAPTHNCHESISAPNRGFCQESAEAMVAMARLRGWKALNVSGTVEQREMLWLAVQRQNLKEKTAFEEGQRNGSIPKNDKDGKPLEYVPLTVNNYAPELNSKIDLQWQAEYDALHPVKVENAAAKPPAPARPPPPPPPPPAAGKTPVPVTESKFVNTSTAREPSRTPPGKPEKTHPQKHPHHHKKNRGGPKHP